MPASKKVQAKAVTKANKDSRRGGASLQLAIQGKKPIDSAMAEMGKGVKSGLKAVAVGVKPSTTKGSSKYATGSKRVNQSIVARGGKPVATYRKKAK
jgi:hypothetical protein